MITQEQQDRLTSAVAWAKAAAEGDSNDEEIEALTAALDEALHILGMKGVWQ